ncbi:3-dehydroquinate synthase [Microlunatus elymi]|uniref:3-dehydroquinate synthase n=1 Tax=Microlunatus elymi TaxID=2596828 RepID=A0A516PZY6_9ACTN|nr:3-dehydroquinate synthase [Microlunatus elymi]QDP96739.1 3-dehydroquinate synthase [Microlunatus elymi]
MNAPSFTITVQTDQPYDVRIGPGVIEAVPELVRSSQRVAILHPQSCMDLVSGLERRLVDQGQEVVRIPVPDAEEAKTAQVLAYCWASLGKAGFTRSDSVIGVGGGATTDLAGFVAATWLRGVRLVTVPTTLLGMVDAAVGGKTGINTAEGKNLVGAFYEPAGVVCDLTALRTLPVEELRPGLAEVIKCGFIADPAILDLVADRTAQVQDPESAELAELVRRSITVKAEVVAKDLRESTSVGTAVGRELLNYGHTLGHAIERREHYRWRHGNAVSVGMVYVAELSRRAGHLSDEVASRHAELLSSVGLPTTYDPDAFDDLLAGMALDKKSRGSTLRFVILDDRSSPGDAARRHTQATMLVGPPTSMLEEAYAAINGESQISAR